MEYENQHQQIITNAQQHVLIDPVTTILTLCSAIAQKRDEKTLSLEEGGYWALDHMDPKYHKLIRKMLDAKEAGTFNLAGADFIYLKACAGGLLYEFQKS